MAEITIDTKFLNIGKDEIKVVPVGSLYDAATDLQLEFLETDDSNKKEKKEEKDSNPLLDAINQERTIKKHCKDLLEKIGISKKEWDKVNDSLTNNDIIRYTSYVISCIKGANFKDYEDYVNTIESQQKKATKEDPKKS